MTLEPLFSRLWIRVPDEKKETDGGIDIPDTHSADRPEMGTVTAKGPDVKCVNVGDDVLFKKYSPDEITLDGKKEYVLAEEDVIAIIRN